jgi:hypothetical protein
MEAGHRMWLVPAGRIPILSHGAEPEFTSRDTLGLLNAGTEQAAVRLTVFHAERDPVGPYCLDVPGERVRHVRINDLIDPEAVPLDADYGLMVEASRPVVVQFTRQDTGAAANARLGALAFPLDSPSGAGRYEWAIADGLLPAGAAGERDTGVEETAFVLNAGDRDASLRVTVYLADGPPETTSAVTVPARRVRRVHLDRLVAPSRGLRGTSYGVVLASDCPVVVQHLRIDRRQAENSLTSSFGHPA